MEDPELAASFMPDQPQVEPSSSSQLDIKLTLEELHEALMSLAYWKAPGIDGIPRL